MALGIAYLFCVCSYSNRISKAQNLYNYSLNMKVVILVEISLGLKNGVNKLIHKQLTFVFVIQIRCWVINLQRDIESSIYHLHVELFQPSVTCVGDDKPVVQFWYTVNRKGVYYTLEWCLIYKVGLFIKHGRAYTGLKVY